VLQLLLLPGAMKGLQGSAHVTQQWCDASTVTVVAAAANMARMQVDR
jgi:hypothetical protein